MADLSDRSTKTEVTMYRARLHSEASEWACSSMPQCLHN